MAFLRAQYEGIFRKQLMYSWGGNFHDFPLCTIVLCKKASRQSTWGWNFPGYLKKCIDNLIPLLGPKQISNQKLPMFFCWENHLRWFQFPQTTKFQFKRKVSLDGEKSTTFLLEGSPKIKKDIHKFQVYTGPFSCIFTRVYHPPISTISTCAISKTASFNAQRAGSLG